MQLRVGEIAREQGVRLTQIQRRTQIPTATVRRYFYSSKTGLERDAGSLKFISLAFLEQIAQALDVEPADLLARQGMGEQDHDNDN